MKRTSLALASALLIGLWLGACGSTPAAIPSEAPTGLTLIDALGRTTSFSYDDAGNLHSTTDPIPFRMALKAGEEDPKPPIDDPGGSVARGG